MYFLKRAPARNCFYNFFSTTLIGPPFLTISNQNNHVNPLFLQISEGLVIDNRESENSFAAF